MSDEQAFIVALYYVADVIELTDVPIWVQERMFA